MGTSSDKQGVDRLNRMTTMAELRPLLETVADDGLNPVVLRALEVVDFPKRGQRVPLPEELTAPQRELAEILAQRANVTCLSMHAIPKKVQQRRRWLGIDPPSLLERPVTLDVAGETVERPLWWACSYLVERRAGELIPSLISRDELFQLAVEVSLWRGEIYDVGFGYPASWLQPYDLAEDGSQAAWAAEKLAEIATWSRPESRGEVDGIQYFQAAAGRDSFDPPMSLDGTKAAFGYLFSALAAGGLSIRPEWEIFLPWAGPPLMTRMLAAIPEPRREAAAVAAFRRTLPKSALETAFDVLPTFPSAALADAVRELLQSPTITEGPYASLLSGWRKRWKALEQELPATVWRPLGGGGAKTSAATPKKARADTGAGAAKETAVTPKKPRAPRKKGQS
jgi:hypothetical protein